MITGARNPKRGFGLQEVGLEPPAGKLASGAGLGQQAEAGAVWGAILAAFGRFPFFALRFLASVFVLFVLLFLGSVDFEQGTANEIVCCYQYPTKGYHTGALNPMQNFI